MATVTKEVMRAWIRITRRIKKSAREDKIKHSKEKLAEGINSREKWQAVKERNFQPNFSKGIFFVQFVW